MTKAMFYRVTRHTGPIDFAKLDDCAVVKDRRFGWVITDCVPSEAEYLGLYDAPEKLIDYAERTNS